MATKRFRNNARAYTVRRKSVLPKPVHLTFKDEEEGAPQLLAKYQEVVLGRESQRRHEP